jgi:hypothetical protein
MSGFESSDPTPNEKGVWYKIYVSECPQCGRGEVHRTRMPAPRPEKDQDRYEFDQHYDYCDY